MCLDSAEENMVVELALAADHVLPERWNGWLRPVATAAAVADFMARWRRIDPNGVWGEAYESDSELVCPRSDDDGTQPESFARVGTAAGGEGDCCMNR
ncbi:hypothetical protein VV01_21760 [Luteipulveratus halotolerans]|uniref:Uncharacterized protein n=1 Tax=Luteipulveratus halotolerans TaxID=1631356 RepID=A0A0L6CE69_9MICO|nr:hypothetical protein VV01_21760 [Luteipulveratus halotolerans]